MHRIRNRIPTGRALVLAAGAVAVSPAAQAGDWQVEPRIGVEEKWTDNAYSTSADRKADFITTVNPGIKITGKGPHLDVGIDYDLGYDSYAAQNDLNGFRHRGLGTAKAEVLKDFFFIDGRAAVTEQEVQPTGATTAGDRTAASNRTRVTTTSVSPRVQHDFGGWVQGMAAYTHSEVVNDSTGTGTNTGSSTSLSSNNSSTDSAKAGVRSGENFSRLLWSYDLSTVNNESDQRSFSQTSNTIGGGYHLDRDWTVLAHVGDDYLNSEQLDSDKYSGVFYGGGVRWTPSPRTDIKTEIGRRYDGVDFSLEGSHLLTPRTSVKVSRKTGISTEGLTFTDALATMQRDEQGRFVNPFSGFDADPNASPFARTTSVFKQTSTNLSVQHSRERDTLRGTVGVSTREPTSSTNTTTTTPSSTDAVPVTGEISALTLQLSWSHRLSELLTGTVSVSESDVYDAPTEAEKTRRLRVSGDLTYQMNPTLTGLLSYRYLDQENQGKPGVTENMLSMGLRKVF